MKRKYLLLTSGVVLWTGLAALTGCGQKKDPYTVYTEATQKTSELTSMESTSETTISLAAEEAGLNMDIDMNMDIKISGIGSDSVLADIDMTIDMMGESTSVKSYYKDGYYYYGDSSNGVKYPMDIEELESQILSASTQALNEEDFKEISMEKKDKEYLLTYTINGDSMNEILDSLLSSVPDLASLTDLGMELEMSDVSGTSTVNKDGYFTKAVLTIPMSMDIAGQSLSLEITNSNTYVDPGKEVTVELPDDLDSYQEIDADTAD